MLVLVIKFRICRYEITIHHLKNVTLLWRHIVFVVDDARPASSSSTRLRRRPASKDPCPGLGSAGLALGGATFRGATLGEEPGPGSRRRPSSPLGAFAWATFGAEGAGPAGGGTSPCQGGGRARPRYMAAMDVRFSNTWQVLWGDHPSYDPVMFPSLWLSTAAPQEPRVA